MSQIKAEILLIILIQLICSSVVANECTDKLKLMRDFPQPKSSKSAFITCLQEYVRIPSLTKPAEEYKVAPFFTEIFKTFSIPYKTFWTTDPQAPQGKRFNIIATLSAEKASKYDWKEATRTPSIILLSHTDVIDVHPDQWRKPRLVFSGEITHDSDGDHLWGRGSIDMKGIAIMQLISIFEIYFSKSELDHDIHFLAVAGEESNGSGAMGAIRLIRPNGELAALQNAKIILNEGGGGIYMKRIKKNLVVLDAEQKGGAWLKVDNDSLQDLLFNLSLWHLSKLKKLNIKTNENLQSCEVQDVSTPKSKVNVSPSKFIATIACPHLISSESEELIRTSLKFHYPEISIESDIQGKFLELHFSSKGSGHGSLKKGQGLLEKAFSLFYSLNLINAKRFDQALLTSTPSYLNPHLTPANKRLVEVLSYEILELQVIRFFSFIPPVKDFLLKQMSKALGVANAFETSCNFTNISSMIKNSKKYYQAYIDCRLVHSFKLGQKENHAQRFVEELKHLTPFLNSKIELISGWNYTFSDVANPYLLNVVKTIIGKESGRVVSPFMNIAGSDSTWFRAPHLVSNSKMSPIPAYGYVPFIYTPEIIATIHGSNERFPLKQVDYSLSTYIKIVKNLTLR